MAMPCHDKNSIFSDLCAHDDVLNYRTRSLLTLLRMRSGKAKKDTVIYVELVILSYFSFSGNEK
jgi:hypothetical protein